MGAKTKINQLNSKSLYWRKSYKVLLNKEPTLLVGLRVTGICNLAGAKEQLSHEIEELKQSKEELEVRMNALKSQYEGRLLRVDRELRELRETQMHSEPREEPQDQSGAKVCTSRWLLVDIFIIPGL